MQQSIFQNKKKIILIAIAVLAVYWAVSFLLNNSWLTISSSTPAETAVFVRGENSEQDFKLTNTSKRLKLKRGVYAVEASEGDKFSLYSTRLGYLWNNRIDLELLSQKIAEYLGKDPRACVKQTADLELLYYSCGQSDTPTVFSDRRGIGPAPENLEEAGESGTAGASNFSVTLKNYGAGFLEAETYEGVLSIRQRDGIEYETGREPIKIRGFKSAVSDQTFSTAWEAENFAAFDSKKLSLMNFKNLTDNKPAVIEVPKDKIDRKTYETTVVAGKNYSYLFNYLSAANLEDHSQLDREIEGPESEPKILLYSRAENKLSGEHSLPMGWQIRDIVPGPDDSILLVLSGAHEGETYFIKGSKGPVKLDGVAKIPENTCWKDRDSFYYSADAGSNIFLYSLSKQASFLVYGNLAAGTTIQGLSCDKGTLYFTLDSDKDGDIDNYIHYKLGQKDHRGARVESVLPEYIEVANEAIELGLAGDKVKVDLIYDSNNDGAGPAKDQVVKAARDLLSKNNVDVSNVEFLFSY